MIRARQPAANTPAALALLCLGVACQVDHWLGLDVTPNAACDNALSVAGDFRVCSAGYLAPSGADPAIVLDVGQTAPGQDPLLVAGLSLSALPSPNGATPVLAILGGGAAGVVRFSGSGREVISRTALGARITDLQVGGLDGRIAVAGVPFGTAVLDARATTALFHDPFPATRIAIGDDGTVAALDVSGTIEIRDRHGARLAAIAPDSTIVREDLAVHAPSRSVLIAGHAVVGPGRVPILRAHAYDGTARWRAYGWSAADIDARSLQADSRALRVTIGRDGAAYLLGESHGGNTVFGRDPTDLDRSIATAGNDPFSQAYKTNQAILFVARLQPADGTIDVARFLLSREPADNAGEGRGVHADALAVDEKGRVLVGGRMDCCIPDGERPTLRGQVTAEGTEDAFVVLFDAGLGGRRLWSTFGARAGGRVSGLAFARGISAVAVVQNEAGGPRAPLLPFAPLLAPGIPSAASPYLAVWQTP